MQPGPPFQPQPQPQPHTHPQSARCLWPARRSLHRSLGRGRPASRIESTELATKDLAAEPRRGGRPPLSPRLGGQSLRVKGGGAAGPTGAVGPEGRPGEDCSWLSPPQRRSPPAMTASSRRRRRGRGALASQNTRSSVAPQRAPRARDDDLQELRGLNSPSAGPAAGPRLRPAFVADPIAPGAPLVWGRRGAKKMYGHGKLIRIRYRTAFRALISGVLIRML